MARVSVDRSHSERGIRGIILLEQGTEASNFVGLETFEIRDGIIP
jgi:hypothetical protein